AGGSHRFASPTTNTRSKETEMSQLASNRRTFLRGVTAATVATSAIALTTTGSEAYQGNMERALSALYDALASLREATPTKGGQKETAVQLVEQAIAEVNAGIQFANEHGGG